MCFYLFMASFVNILNFLRWNLPTFSQHIESYRIRILKTQKVGFGNAGFSIYANLRLLPLRKSGLIDFPEKRAPTKVKHLLPVCQVARFFTEWNARKFSQFRFLCSCWRNKILKNTSVFLRARADYLKSFPSIALCIPTAHNFSLQGTLTFHTTNQHRCSRWSPLCITKTCLYRYAGVRNAFWLPRYPR